MADPDATPRPIKVHFIKTPFHESSGSAILLLSVGLIVSWILGYCAAIFIFFLGVELLKSEHSTVRYLVAVGFAFIGPVLWVIFFQRMSHRRAGLKSKKRSSRLAVLRRHDAAQTRLPHRMVEYAMRRSPSTNRGLNRVARTIPPNHLIIANEPKEHRGLLTTTCSISFEPVDLVGDELHISQLLTALIEPQTGAPPDSNKKSAPKGFHPLRQAIGIGLFIVFVVLPCGYMLFGLIRGGISRGNLGILVLIGCLLSQALRPVLFERRWWLVPGGLVYREYRFWKKRLRAGVLRPNDTPLFVDLRAGFAFVRRDRRFLKLLCPRAAGCLLVAAWSSQARSPSDQEIEAFLGQKLSN